MKLYHWITAAFLLIFAAFSLAGEIRFKRGGTNNMPTVVTAGEPLFNVSTNILYVGTGTGKQRIGPFESYSGPTGYDARSIPPLFCRVDTTGTTQISYDSTGNNPSPSALSAFTVNLWNSSESVTPTRYLWSVLDGLNPQQTANATVTPTVRTTWNPTLGAGRVFTQVTYSTATIFGGKRYCYSELPVNILRDGAVGGTGATGPPGLSTRATINTVMRNLSTQYAQSANEMWQMMPLTNLSTHYLKGTRDYLGNARWRQSGHGYQEFLSANGNEVVKIMTDGTLMLLKGGQLRLHIKNDGGIVHYRNNLPVFEVLSSGKYRGQEGWPTGTKRINYTLANGFRGYTTIVGTGGGSGTPGGATTQVQVNDGGAFGGYTTFVFRKADSQLTIHGSMVIK